MARGKRSGRPRRGAQKPTSRAAPRTTDASTAVQKDELTPEQRLKRVFAEVMVKGIGTNASAAAGYSKMLGQVDLIECLNALGEQTREAQQGNLAPLEAILAAQAVTLNAIFTQLALEASKMQLVDHIDRFTRLAFRAQSQCRATVETLALIKSPPTIIARQANVANGPQQVNNAMIGAPPGRGALARDVESGKIELLETNNERVDVGAASASVERYQTVAAVEVVNRSSNR